MDKQKVDIVVIGGGISGITTAIEAAETGYKVILIEKLPYLGGRVVKVNRYFPKLCPPTCGLEINYTRIKANPNISVFTSSEVDKISGTKGAFEILVKRQPNYVNTDCTACGECEKVCPESRKDEFNYNLSTTKAIYMPHGMAYPWKYTIDDNTCQKEACNKCVEVCKYNAIDLNASRENIYIEAATVVIATGWKPYGAAKIDNLKYARYDDVISNVEMERLSAPDGPTKGEVLRFSDNKKVNSIAFVQCAGSRDEKHQAWCSGVCCSASLKQALAFMEHNKEAEVTIFYIDIRVSGRNEDFLERVKNQGKIELIKGKVADIDYNKATEKYIVHAENIEVGKKMYKEFDMVVLATGIEAELPDIIGDSADQFGFISEAKLQEGIFAAGCCKKPMDVSSSLKDATGKALKAIQVVRNPN
ncbi:MAG: CoB--CoM heterodisulfide reductase iron-sulfur subunit A family protein [Bacteroidales bacterium]|nr:CoB--CoM heterodisulfide reductase iron-sulfur subunit A family protein [Bacteroidales bacterium]